MAKIFTIGYGGRKPEEFVRLLTVHGIRTLVDVRLRPHRASMGIYVKAKTPDKGIEKLLRPSGIAYISLTGLGNPFLDQDNWAERFRIFIEEKGDELITPLRNVEPPFCLMCAEKKPQDCHRLHIAEYLEKNGWGTVVHIV